MPAPPSPASPAADRNWAGLAFLVLLPGAVGCLLCGLLLDPQAVAGRFLLACTTVALIMTVVGVVAPVARTKKPLRAYRMLQGVGRSPLSRQAAFVALFLALLIVEWAVALSGRAALWLQVLVVVAGFAAVLAATHTYVLGSQPRWRHWSSVAGLVATVLALGVALGLVVALGWRDGLLARDGAHITAVALAMAGVCALLAGAWAWRRRWVSLTMLFIALVAAALSLFTPWPAIVAAGAVAAALVMWRTSFFLAASRNGWRREVRWLRPQTYDKEA